MYRKPTHTDHYLHFGSHHPLIHKLGVIRTLFYRADTIISENKDIEEEKKHIKVALDKCGYPGWSFHKAKKTKEDTQKPSQPRQGNRRPARVTVPYVEGLSDKLKKLFKSHNISASLKPANSLRSNLVNVKDRQARDKTSNLVYGVKCAKEGCTDTYVGETKQSLKARMSQHRRPSTGDQYDSAVFTHLETTGHSFKNEDVIILDREERWFERGVKEAIWERVERPSLNRRGGLRVQLSHAWDRALKQLTRRLSPPQQHNPDQSADHQAEQQAESFAC